MQRVLPGALWILIVLANLPVARAQDCMTWVRRDDVGSPGPQTRHTMTYDPDRRRVVLFTSDETGELWDYDGSRWSRVMVSGARPSPRLDSAMVYDMRRQELVLVGGFGRRENDLLADTWTCRVVVDDAGNATGTWRRRADFPDSWQTDSSDPERLRGEAGARAEHSLVYDRHAGTVLLFGGKTRVIHGAPYHDAYNRENYSPGSGRWDGNAWTDRGWSSSRVFARNAGDRPPVSGRLLERRELGRKQVGTAYDSGRFRVITFGGLRQIYQQRDDGAAIDNIQDEAYIEAVPGLQHIVPPLDEPSTWDFFLWGGIGAGGRCGQFDVQRPFGARLVYDSRRDRYIAFGGSYVTGEVRGMPCAPYQGVDTSEYQSQILPNDRSFREWAPSIDYNPGELDDMIRDYYSGENGVPAPPASRIGHAMVFDEHRGVTVVYGGWDGNLGSLNTIARETWEYRPGLLDFLEQPPARSELCEGDELVLRVSPLALAVPEFQWFKGGRAIEGATNRVYSVPAVDAAVAGTYACELTDRCGNRVRSRDAVVRVGGPPVIVTQPASVLLCPGEDATVTFFFDSDYTAVVEWFRLGANGGGEVQLGAIDRVPGADSNTLQFRGMQPAQSGYYAARVTNRCGSVWTTPIQIVAGIWLRSVPRDSTNEVCSPHQLQVAASGKGPVRFQWRRNGFPLVATDRVVGTTTNVLRFLGLRYLDDAVYDCVISNDCHGVTTRVARVSLVPNPPFVLADTNGPPARTQHRLVYDAHRRRHVMFGGMGTEFGAIQNTRNDTWEYDGTNWVQVVQAVAPSPRVDFGFAYDADRRRVVLFGGATNSAFAGSSPNGETWEYDGTNWMQFRPTTSPRPRVHPALFYDPVRKVTTLYGGDTDDPGNPRPGDLWVWNGTNWLARAVPGPRPLFGGQYGSPPRPQMVWDEARGYAVLPPVFPNDGTSSLRVTWVWNGEHWAPHEHVFAGFGITPTQAGSGGGMVFDTYRQEVIYWGGDGSDQTWLWRWNGTGWRRDDIDERAGYRLRAASAYDRHRHSVVQFGGQYTGTDVGLRGVHPWTFERLLADEPVLLRPPVALDDPESGGRLLRVVAAGAPPLTYRWQREGEPLRDGFPYSGTTNATLRVDRSLANDPGVYRCLVQGRCGAFLSPSLTVGGSVGPAQTLTAISAPVAGVPGLRLVWSDPLAVLETAPVLSGPWTVVDSARSPYQAPTSGGAGFFRIRAATGSR